MQVSLGKGNLNAGFGKLLEYHKIKIASNPASRRFADVNPDEQLEIDGVVGILNKANHRPMGFFY